MPRLPYLFIWICLLLAVAGCAAPSKPAPSQTSLSSLELEALKKTQRLRFEQAMRTQWGLPAEFQAMLHKRAAQKAARIARPAPPPLPPITRPSSIPGVRRILIVGDSFAVGVGMTMSGQIKGMGVRLTEKGKTSSGLNSPRFYNWEEKLVAFMDVERPDVLVAMISGNDAHNGSGSESWKRSYVTRLQQFVQLAQDAGVAVYMVGLPPMGKPDYSQRANVANQAVRQVCDESSACHYVDTWRIFSDQQGNYVRVKSFDGKPVTLRAKDGVHFTMNGYKILSAAILQRIADTYTRASRQ